MADTTGIYNRALQLLGATPIISTEDDSKSARAINTAAVPVRQASIRAHNWSFAIKRVQLAADSVAPVFGPARAFTVPSDWLKTLPPDDDDNHWDHDWVMEGRKILTNDTDPLNLKYLSDVTDANQMDALFREFYAHELALAMCEGLTNSSSKKRELRRDRDNIVSEARRTNSIEKPAQKPPRDPWLTGRA